MNNLILMTQTRNWGGDGVLLILKIWAAGCITAALIGLLCWYIWTRRAPSPNKNELSPETNRKLRKFTIYFLQGMIVYAWLLVVVLEIYIRSAG